MNSDFKIENGVLVKYIGTDAIVTVPDGVTVIGNKAFYYSRNVQRVVLPDSVCEIRGSAFGHCGKLESINIPDGVVRISEKAFKNCRVLKAVHLPDSVIEIGANAYYACYKLAKVRFSQSLSVIGDWAFGACNALAEIVLPPTLTSIGKNAFCSCSSLKTVAIPDCLSELQHGTFQWCFELEEAVIPSSVTFIGTDVFYHCDELTIKAPADSCAQEYARKNSIPFVTLGNSSRPSAEKSERSPRIKAEPLLQLPYDGDKPYIFVSYSHNDADTVYPLIAALQQRGFRVWYDKRGIRGGTDYSAKIATQIENCAFVISFFTQNYMQSTFCINELLYAIDEHKKKLLPVYLEDITLPKELKIFLMRIQHLCQWELSEAEFLDELCHAEGIDICR